MDLVVSFFGVLRSGGAYLPLDPANPVERLDWMARDADLTSVVTDTQNRNLVPGSLATVLIDQESAEPDPTWSSAFEQSADSLAYVIYTSGSTGRPKGVMVSHSNAFELVRAQREAGLVPAGSNVLGFAPIGFDASIWEMLMAVGHGAPLHYADSPDDLSGIENCVATLVPSILDVLDPSEMRFTSVISVGERLDASLAKRWSRTVPVSNAYGPAEATVWATLSEVLTRFTEEPGIGRARSGCSVYLVDAMGHLVTPGDVGELCIGGNGVSRGYLGRPGLTAARFQPNPWGPAGSRLYRTGDLARQRPDGSYEFRGRIDDQVKIGGRRVELGEIESALRTIDGVEDARVVLAKAHQGDAKLVAAVRPGNFAGTDEQVINLLKKRLPEYMIPTSISRVDSFPLTVNGKFDGAALRERAPAAEPVSALDHPVNTLVAALWAGTLGVPKVGPDDNFFSLGGHSLLASRLIARLRSTLRVQIPVSSLFQSPVLRVFLDDVVARAIRDRHDPEADRAYWRGLLSDPRDFSEVPPLWSASGPLSAGLPFGDFDVPPGVVEAVRDFARDEWVTPFMVYVAAFGVALGDHVMARELVIGASTGVGQSSGRSPATVLMRVASYDATLATAVASVRSGIVGAYSHDDFPRDIPADLEPDSSGHVLLGFLVSVNEPDSDREPARGAFHLKLTEDVAGLHGAIRIAAEFSDEREILRGFHDTFRTVLRQLHSS
ncbi:amino acid adenylation domain-containing protein [Pseudonocardia eucalypti]|nr:amino acid adenylation domain-containing protein [Pseudonocardia eucalypti]